MKNYLLLLVAAASFTFTSCGNDDDEVVTPTAPTKTELISSTAWKLEKAIITVNGTDTDYTNNIPACDKDNLEIYAANGTYTSDEGPTKCDPANPQTRISGTWMFTNNETKLKLSTTPVEAEIVELTSSKLVLKATESGQTSTLTLIPQ